MIDCSCAMTANITCEENKIIKTVGTLAALFFCWECAIDKLFDAETHNIPNLHI